MAYREKISVVVGETNEEVNAEARSLSLLRNKPPND